MTTDLPRAALRTLVVLAVLAMLVLATGTGQATVAQQGPEDAATARAVAALTGPRRDATVLPVSFLTGAGYRPVARAGMLVDPRGSCSSPVALPGAFDEACRAHDLGYDLLRHAAASGAPLGGWARRAIDAQLERDLAAACDTTSVPDGCHVVAGAVDVVVVVNSWRQGDSVPVVEHGPFVWERA